MVELSIPLTFLELLGLKEALHDTSNIHSLMLNVYIAPLKENYSTVLQGEKKTHVTTFYLKDEVRQCEASLSTSKSRSWLGSSYFTPRRMLKAGRHTRRGP